MYYDLLVRIKNATLARKKTVRLPWSSMDFEVAQVLVKEKYIKTAKKKTFGKMSVIEIELHAVHVGLQDFRLISTPGRRLYAGYRTLKPIRQGYGAAVLSTPKGILTAKEARKEKVGGEYLFQIW